jgi:hypothetical protein
VRKKAFQNFKSGGRQNIEVDSLAHALAYAFSWSKTKEGQRYWQVIHMMAYKNDTI